MAGRSGEGGGITTFINKLGLGYFDEKRIVKEKKIGLKLNIALSTLKAAYDVYYTLCTRIPLIARQRFRTERFQRRTNRFVLYIH